MADKIHVAAPPAKPLLIFDGDCGFCRNWAERWRQLTVESVDYAPSQEMAVKFPEIPAENFKRSVQFVETDGAVYSGAEAAFRSLSYSRRRRGLFKCYQYLPGFAAVTELGYRMVAAHRDGAARVTRLLWGRSLDDSSFVLTRSVFLRALGAVYLIAFVSLRLQIDGLYGHSGIIPVEEVMKEYSASFGERAFWQFPTLCWYGTSDVFLRTLCDAGALAACLSMFGVLPILSSIVTWFLYLSMVNSGPVFMGFQWDGLLLDAGFIAIFFSPWALTLKRAAKEPVSLIALFLLYWLLFRLMFSSGVVKLTSGDPNWRNLTAMSYHYETQPIPTWTAWYMHQLPLWFHQAETILVFLAELAVPWLIFAPRGLRRIGAYLLIAFQIALMATGNYAFFNLLTIALCIPLLDDDAWPLRRWRKATARPEKFWRWTAWPMALVAIPLFVVSTTLMFERMHIPSVWAPSEDVLHNRTLLTVEQWFSFRYHVCSEYGLFEVMTRQRPSIIIEGSNDGKEWKPYEFKYKPGDRSRRPPFIAPYQPRLDWQMWFASMGTIRYHPWVMSLLMRLHEGSAPVLGLLETNPFPEAPPKYLRAVLYDYHFTNFSNQDEKKLWWTRKPVGLYFPEPREEP